MINFWLSLIDFFLSHRIVEVHPMKSWSVISIKLQSWMKDFSEKFWVANEIFVEKQTRVMCNAMQRDLMNISQASVLIWKIFPTV